MVRRERQDTEYLKLVVGYRNYVNLERLREGLTRYNDRLEAGMPGQPWVLAHANQSAQRVYDDAVGSEADLVLINPLIEGYHHGLLRDLIMFEEKPIPVIGMIPGRSDLGREMLNNGAAGKVSLPLDEAAVASFFSQAQKAVDQAWRERAEGRVQFQAAHTAGAADLSYERKNIAIWVPKGGGSTRTTIAVNLAVALSHISLGGARTLLVDLDMSKGDCHTLLGYSTDLDEAIRTGQAYLGQDLHTLVVRVAAAYSRRGMAAMDAAEINGVLAEWRANASHLSLLPGLTSPAQAAAEEFSNKGLLYNLCRRLLTLLRGRGSFVICDLGQDFTQPFHRAALDDADHVIVPVPPTRTAILDTRNALPALKHQMGGTLEKFSLVLTAFDPTFGYTKADIQAQLPQLPLIATLPFDALTANTAQNSGEPIVLMAPDSPLAQEILNLASVFKPGLGEQKTSGLAAVGRTLTTLFVKEK